MTVNAAMKLNWVVLQLDTVLRYVLVTVLVFTLLNNLLDPSLAGSIDKRIPPKSEVNHMQVVLMGN